MNVVMRKPELNLTPAAPSVNRIIRAVRGRPATVARWRARHDYRRPGVCNMSEERRSP